MKNLRVATLVSDVYSNFLMNIIFSICIWHHFNIHHEYRKHHKIENNKLNCFVHWQIVSLSRNYLNYSKAFIQTVKLLGNRKPKTALESFKAFGYISVLCECKCILLLVYFC